MFCDELEGWNVGEEGRPKREGIYGYICLIHFIVWQKLIQHCKAIILQLKKKPERGKVKKNRESVE